MAASRSNPSPPSRPTSQIITRWIGCGIGAALVVTSLALSFAGECTDTSEANVLSVTLGLAAAIVLWGLVGGLQVDLKLRFRALGEVSAAGVAAIFLALHFGSRDGLVSADCPVRTAARTVDAEQSTEPSLEEPSRSPEAEPVEAPPEPSSETEAPPAVPPAQSPTVELDVLALAEAGRWASGHHNGKGFAEVVELPFGVESDEPIVGYAGRLRRSLEDGREHTIVHVHPRWEDWGSVVGTLPPVTLGPNAVFEASVGFIAGAAATDGVTFEVWASWGGATSAVAERIAHVHDRYDGRLAPVRADLSHLAGQEVTFTLMTHAGPSSGQDWAAWVFPGS